MPNQKRRFLRFPGDGKTCAEVDRFSKEHEPFQADLTGLVSQEAYGGCALVFLNRENLELDFHPDNRCRIKMGHMDPLPAKAVWVRNLDPDVIKVGFQYLDPMTEQARHDLDERVVTTAG